MRDRDELLGIRKFRFDVVNELAVLKLEACSTGSSGSRLLQLQNPTGPSSPRGGERRMAVAVEPVPDELADRRVDGEYAVSFEDVPDGVSLAIVMDEMEPRPVHPEFPNALRLAGGTERVVEDLASADPSPHERPHLLRSGWMSGHSGIPNVSDRPPDRVHDKDVRQRSAAKTARPTAKSRPRTINDVVSCRNTAIWQRDVGGVEMRNAIEYRTVELLGTDEFIDLLVRSTLAERRPVNDRERIARMISGANIVIGAYEVGGGRLVGVARSLSDFAYCCYLSDLAVDKAHQGKGIGRRLVELTRQAAGPEAMCLLVSAPASKSFYDRIGMPSSGLAFMFPRER